MRTVAVSVLLFLCMLHVVVLTKPFVSVLQM